MGNGGWGMKVQIASWSNGRGLLLDTMFGEAVPLTNERFPFPIQSFPIPS
jgi:hypothetical protein